MRQNSDPEFAQILIKIRESNHAYDDVRETKFLANGFLKIYWSNCLENIENERCTEKWRTELGRDVISIYAKYSSRDIETETLWVKL